jgi:hypothetical protein
MAPGTPTTLHNTQHHTLRSSCSCDMCCSWLLILSLHRAGVTVLPLLRPTHGGFCLCLPLYLYLVYAAGPAALLFSTRCSLAHGALRRRVQVVVRVRLAQRKARCWAAIHSMATATAAAAAGGGGEPVMAAASDEVRRDCCCRRDSAAADASKSSKEARMQAAAGRRRHACGRWCMRSYSRL